MMNLLLLVRYIPMLSILIWFLMSTQACSLTTGGQAASVNNPAGTAASAAKKNNAVKEKAKTNQTIAVTANAGVVHKNGSQGMAGQGTASGAAAAIADGADERFFLNFGAAV